jgi:glycosyltransferase involved in cell wall biosynthesis
VTPLRVCIEARLHEASAGGCQQVLIGLAAGLSALTDSEEEFHFALLENGGDWLAGHLSGPCRAVRIPNPPAPPPRPSLRDTVSALLPGKVKAALRPAVDFLRSRRPFPVAASDGVAERLGCQIVHFPHQEAYRTEIPSIYHPHDLQHRHLPEFFSAQVIRRRDALYPEFCNRAAAVAVTSTWVKNDLVAQYGIPAAKIAVVPLAPVLGSYPNPTPEDLEATRRKYRLPDAFGFYPAQTWKHKNHLGLLRALADLRARGQLDDIHLVFSGMKNDFYDEIEREMTRLGLADRMVFLGFVSPLELQCLYRLARCAIIPSKFEAASFPLWEAFLSGVPAACSRVTSLPAQAGDAALLFDPNDPAEIGTTLRRLWLDPELRRQLAARGTSAVQRFTWRQTASMFRAHYRRISGRALSPDDRALLDAPPAL